MARYFALPKIIAILQDPEIEPIYERGRDKIKDIEFWHFSAIVDGVAVKLILRSIRGERKHLYSIMWKGEVSGHANGRADQKKSCLSHISAKSGSGYPSAPSRVYQVCQGYVKPETRSC